METKVEALENNSVKMTVTIESADIDSRIKKTYKDFAYKYNFPGFRRGKAPRPIIDNALGAEAVRATVTDAVVNENAPLAVDASGYYPVSKLDYEDGGLVEEGKPYSFSFTMAVKPALELDSYEPVEIELPCEGASDTEIDEQIESMREHYYNFEDASAATKIKKDGYAELSMKATGDDGKDIETLSSESRVYGLGTGLFPESFDEELLGLKKGDTKSFSIDVPTEGAILMTSLAGKTAKVQFDIEVKAVKKKVLPELSDEWAKETMGFESVADLRERMASSIAQQKASVLPRLKENACLEALGARLQGEVPESMVEEAEANLLQDFFRQLQHQGMTFDNYLAQQDLTPDQFKDDVKKQAKDSATSDLALDAWAKHFEFVATDEEVSNEFVLAGVEDPKELEDDWRKNGQLYLVRQGVLRRQSMDDVMEKAVITEVDYAKRAAEEKKADEKPVKKAEKKPAKKSSTKSAKSVEKDEKPAKDSADAADKTADKPAEKPAKKPAAKKTSSKKSEDE